MAFLAEAERKKCIVRIAGVSYQLVTTQDETYTRQVASHADEMIRRVMEDSPELNQSMATVLALVNAVDELSQAYRQAKTLEGQRIDADHKADEARRELNRMREQNWEMKKELLRLKKMNRDFQALINQLTEPGQGKESEITDHDTADPVLASAVNPDPDTEVAPKPDPDQAPASEERTDPDCPPGPPVSETQAGSEVPPVSDKNLSPAEVLDSRRAKIAEEPTGDPAEEPDEADTPADTEETGETDEPDLIPDSLDPVARMDHPAKTVDAMRQTNIDDYLRAFGLDDSKKEKKKNHDPES